MLEGFSIIFLSIILEALPFVMIGAMASSLIEIYVSPDWISRRIPKNKIVAFMMIGLVGIIFPVCECAIVPIMRRLIKKGMPVGLAVTFMLAVPIVNPVVLASTYYAFSGDIAMPLLRGGLGYIGAIIVGLTLSRLTKNQIMNKSNLEVEEQGSCCSHGHEHDASCEHGTHNTHDTHSHSKPRNRIKDRVVHIISHTSTELFDVGRYLIMGAFLSALMQVFVPRSVLMHIGNTDIASILIMMALAFVLSLCSEADAFIASTFRQQFSTGSIVGFLIFGPMIDIKNTLMLASTFKAKFIIRLIGTIAVVCFILAVVVNGLF